MSVYFWLVTIFIFLLLLVLFGLTKQFYLEKQIKNIAKPGKLYNVPPNIHLRILEPPEREEFINPRVTIIFESGLGNNCLAWSYVQPKISESVRTVSYDRAGMGWSSKSSKPRTSDQIAKELSGALLEANLEGPFILVGHSAGALFIRSFYQQNPKNVIGMILVDGSHPKEILKGFTLSKIYLQILLILGKMSVRILGRMFINKTTPQFSKLNDMLALQKKAYSTIYEEFKSLPKSFDEIHKLKDYKDLPLYILTHVDGNKNQKWIEWQKDFLNLSTDSKQILCKTGHYIHTDNPNLVIECIEEIIEKNWSKIT